MESKLVLIVDDEPSIRKCMSLWISTFGYKTAAAANANEGYVKYHELNPDMMLVDFRMPAGKEDPNVPKYLPPGTDGPTLAKTLRVNYPQTQTKIIGFTGLFGDIDDSTRAAFDDIIHKSIDTAELKNLLARYSAPQAGAAQVAYA